MLSYAVTVTHNPPRPAPSAATHKSHPVTRPFASPISNFLIANPRLEFPPTHTRQTPLTFSNREYIAVFQVLPSRRHTKNRPRPLHRVTPRLPTRNAGMLAGSFPISCPTTHLPAVPKAQRGGSLLTNHKSPVTDHDFLIGTPRLEFLATATKQSSDTISNRDTSAVFFHNPISCATRTTSTLAPSHPKISPPPTPVLDFPRQSCSEEIFSCATAIRWNFGLCATIPREPRQARKGATVTGQLRVPRITRSSSLAPAFFRITTYESQITSHGLQ
jgi:hypothetical protein